MANLHSYRKLPSDPCLSEEKILAYIDGKLSAAEQHACETHMADCAMCEDAVEGVAMVKDRSLLAAPLKTESEPAEGKVVPLHQPNRKVWYAVAAVLVLILGSTFLINIISSDGVSSEDMAYNPEASYDSTVIAPGEGYATLENELDKQDADCLRSTTGAGGKDAIAEKNRDYKVTVTDANGAGPMEEQIAPPAVDQEEGYVMTERIVADEVADGDAEDLQQKPEQVALKDKSGAVDDTKEEAEKKNNLLDFATGIATGGTKRAESVQKSKQDGYVEDNRNDGVQNAPAGNNNVVTNVNAQPETPKSTMSGGVQTFDIAPADSSAVLLAEVTTINTQDSVGVAVAVSDQLELSYQNGVNLLNAGQTSNAIVMFDKVLTDKNHARYEDAEFQKAKALIKANKKEEAKTLLKAIETKKGKHSSEATELLKTL